MIFRFGRYELDEEAGELRRDGRAVEVQPKPLALLALLLRERARVVSSDELFEALWPGVAVTPSSLTRAVSLARRAIGDGLTGSQVVTLAFQWTSTANSTCTGVLCSTTGNDEVAVRLGMAGTGSGVTADDYPGVGSRNINGDGHFVNVNAVITAVPEPGTLVLLGAGLAGLAFGGRRRAS